eukprot:gene31368-40754_t
MGPYNGISDICATDLWRAGVYGANGVAVSGTAFSSCNYNFASFYPFTPLCLRGCVPSNVGTLSNPANSGNTIYCKDLTTSTSKGYTDVTKIKTTAQLPLNPYRSQLATCLANDCKLVSGTYYQPNPNACSHNATTGAYLYNPTATPTKAPTGSSPTTTVPISSLPPTRAPSASRGPTVVPNSVLIPPTRRPSVTPTTKTSASPSIVPTKSLPPTRGPSVAPSTARPPTTLPTTSRPPTRNPSVAPTTLSPTIASRPPTRRPSIAPSTASVSRPPTRRPSVIPSTISVSRPPTRGPSVSPTTLSPTTASRPPTRRPSVAPTATSVSRPPTRRPSVTPSVASVLPTAVPTTSRPPTRSPSATPSSASPTIASRPPTRRPSVTPTAASLSPSRGPSVVPTVSPTKKASSAPSVVFSKSSVVPSSGIASKKPTGAPTVKQSAPPPKLPGQVAVLTGSTGEIGREIALGLARSGTISDLILPYRDKGKIDRLKDEIFSVNSLCRVHTEYLELLSVSNIKAWTADVSRRFSNLSIIINNAATVTRGKELTVDGYEVQFQVNVLSYYAMMEGFTQVLKANAPYSRVVNVASNYAGELDLSDLFFTRRRYDSNEAYRQAKQANRMLSWAAADQTTGFKDSGVTVNACHPGVVTSKLLASLGMQKGYDQPSKGAETPLYLALSPEVQGILRQYERDDVPVAERVGRKYRTMEYLRTTAP